MKLADARSMMPDLRVAQHNQAADTQALMMLAHWMLRYSPAVSIAGDNGFLLDTTGCDHLFGGEERLVADVQDRLQNIGFRSRLALCDTVGASIALVNHGREDVYILPPGHKADVLDALPVDALRLDDDTITLLKRLGLRTIGDVRPLLRRALERRFRTVKNSKRSNIPSTASQSVQWRLDQISGSVQEPLVYIQEPRSFRAALPCPELALESEAITLALDQLLPLVVQMLDRAGLGARGFRLIAYRADGGSSFAEIYLSQPDNEISVVKRLFRERLDHIDCGYGVDLFLLEAMNTEKILAFQNGMMGAETSHQTASSLAAFADIVNHKTNTHSVLKFAPRSSHVPERSQFAVTITEPANWAQSYPAWSPRPLRLLTRPEPAEVTAELPDSPPAQFIWRKVLRRVVRSTGPERILPEWWHDELATPGSAGMRDYYDVEDSDGLRYWIYRSIKEQVVTKDDEGDAQTRLTLRTTNWFVHGLF